MGRRRWVLSQPARYVDRLPTRRPSGIRLSTTRQPWYRIDAQPPQQWSWETFPTPRSRFDPASGRFRVRYAADAPRVAMRERFDRDGRLVTAKALDATLVALSGSVTVLDLRRDQTLDALGLDDQVSTSRAPEVWHACRVLVDLVHDWFGPRCQGVLYRSRTTPERSANLAFFEHAPLAARSLGRLGDQAVLLDSCVLSEGFEVQGWR